MHALRLPILGSARAEARDEALPAERFVVLTTLAVAVSFALVLMPAQHREPTFLALAAVVGGLLVALSFLCRLFPRATRFVVPLGYLLMAALLRQGEGGSTTGFAGLFLIGITFLALSGRRLELLAGLAVMTLALFVPLVVWGGTGYPSSGYRGAIVLTAAAAIIGFTIQELLGALSKRVERDVLRRVVEAQEVERRRLARELHDETSQTLTSILIGLKSLEETAAPDVVQGLRESIVSTLRGIRRIVVELRPKALDDLGLVPALEALAANVEDQTGVSVDFSADESPGRLEAEVETALYRIVQEGLTNVVRHANADRASVSLSFTDRGVRLVVEDDGHGFDANRGRTNGFGLEGMAERVQLLGGRFSINSRQGGGTSLVVVVPAR